MGRPVVPRSVRVRFWGGVRRGRSLEAASGAAGVSLRTGTQWFVQAGGVIANGVSESSGRLMSFAEREEIAVLRAADHSPAEIARRLGRKSTIGRELARNTTGAQGYRASTAQTVAERRAR